MSESFADPEAQNKIEANKSTQDVDVHTPEPEEVKAPEDE